MRSVKVVVVGDGNVGKTGLLVSYTTSTFPSDGNITTVFDSYSANVRVDDTPVCIAVWDINPRDDRAMLRPLNYPGTDVFLMCFSVMNRASLESVVRKWYPEVSYHCPHAAFFLVGTKTDLRDNPTTATSDTIVSRESGAAMINRMHSKVKFMECSALQHKGVQELFDEAIRVVLAAPPQPPLPPSPPPPPTNNYVCSLL
eukprot:TRINITY_DN15349_c0_g1_i1.p1 TRINITY_DN15349_c0_g1~~TRINITY_DN15349_c0_g1_i1.p1  ORF type:complete len:213 (-),score=66.03 TRINITY_DN15349_c0_g1_i1:109-708(-)